MKLRYVAFLAVLILATCGGQIGVPELIDPTGGEMISLPVNFVWSSVEDAQDYRIEIDTVLSFSDPVVATDVSDTVHTVTDLDTALYYWRVAAYDADDALGEWSDPDSFLITGSGYPRTYVTTITAGGSPFSIDITPNGAELWVNNSDQYDTTVYVINTTSHQVTHQIPVTGFGSGEIEIAPDGGHAFFCASYGTPGIIELSTSTYSQTRVLYFLHGTIQVGPNGYGVAVNSASDRIFAAHYDDATNEGCVAEYNLTTGMMADSVHLNWLYDVDLNHAGNQLYAVSEDDDRVHVIDPSNLTVLDEISVGYDPEVMVITADDSVAYVTHLNDYYFYVLDLTDNSVALTLDIGFSGYGMEITPDGDYLYVCNGGTGVLAILDITNQLHPVLVETLDLPTSSHLTDVCFSNDGQYAYVVAPNDGVLVLSK